MISITKIFEFAAAHHLPHHEGLCKNLHGHNYKLEITVTGPIQKEGPAQGMIIDFGELKVVVEKVSSRFDHQNLNKIFENPTAEIMVQDIAERISYSLYYYYSEVELIKVRLWETSTSYATWKKEISNENK